MAEITFDVKKITETADLFYAAATNLPKNFESVVGVFKMAADKSNSESLRNRHAECQKLLEMIVIPNAESMKNIADALMHQAEVMKGIDN